MPSDSKKNLLYEPCVSCLHGALWLSPASDGTHSQDSLVAPAGRISYLVGSKIKSIPKLLGWESQEKSNSLGAWGGAG